MYSNLLIAILYLVANVSGKCTSQVYESRITAFENGLLNVNNFNQTQGWKNDTDPLDIYSVSSSFAQISASTSSSAWHTLIPPCSSDISTEFEYLQLIVRGPILKNTKVIVKTVDDCTISNPVISSHEFDLNDQSYSEYEGDFVAVQIPLLLFNPEIPNPSHMREIILTNLLPVTDTLSLVRISLLRVNTTCKDVKPEIPGLAWKKDGVLMIDDKPFRFLGFTSFYAVLYMLDHEMDQYIRTLSIYANGTSAALYLPAIVDTCANTCLVTGYRQYNEARLERLDKLLYYAAKYNVKIAISLMRGKYEPIQRYCEFHSCNRFDNSFFTKSVTKESFKHFLNHTMSRRNTATGKLYKDDPAIFYWSFGVELANEVYDIHAPLSWVAEMAEFVKSIDPNHLLHDGYNRADVPIFASMKLWEMQNIDIHSHFYFYPHLDHIIDYCKRGTKLGSSFKKVYIVNQFPVWTETPPERFKYVIENCFPHFFKVGDEYKSSPAAGVFIYQLKSQSAAFFKYDGFGHYYPGGDPNSVISKELMTYMRTKAKWLDLTSNGIPTNSDPEPFPIPSIDPPTIFNISQTSEYVEIDWYSPISGIYISFYKSYDNINFFKLSEVIYGTNQPYIDNLINMTSDCPIPYYYKIVAENKDFNMVSPPALTWIEFRPPIQRKKPSDCYKTTFSTLIIIVNDQNIIIPIVIVSVGLVTVAMTVMVFRKYYLKPELHDKPALIAASNPAYMSGDVENSISQTISNTMEMDLFVPGYLELRKTDFNFDLPPIGAGLTSLVYKGRLVSPKLLDKHGPIEIAIKELKQSEEEAMADFMYEIAILARLPKSPYLLEFVGYTKAPSPSIVMKYYKCSLKDLIVNDQVAMDSIMVLKIALDITTGIHLIHKASILHLDIKPHNILLDVNPDMSFNCVISDFGFSSVIGDGTGKTSQVTGLQEPKTAGITVRYAAPELFMFMNLAQRRLNREDDKKIDVYAWAVTIFEVIERRNAWDNEKFDEVSAKVKSGMRPQFSPDTIQNFNSIGFLFDLVKVAWSQDPMERPGFMFIFAQLTKRFNDLVSTEPSNNTTIPNSTITSFLANQNQQQDKSP